MKNLIKLLALLLMAVAPTAQAYTLSMVPSQTTLSIGDSVSVDVVANALVDGAAPSIGSYDIDVVYDWHLLEFQSAVFGTGLDVLGLGSIQQLVPGIGGINFAEASLDTEEDLNALQPGSFTLFTLTFRAIAPGSSTPFAIPNSVADAAANALVLDDETSAPITVLAPVPLPAAGWLLISGLGALAGFRRRVRAAR